MYLGYYSGVFNPEMRDVESGVKGLALILS